MLTHQCRARAAAFLSTALGRRAGRLGDGRPAAHPPLPDLHRLRSTHYRARRLQAISVRRCMSVCGGACAIVRGVCCARPRIRIFIVALSRDKRNTQSAPAAVALDVHPPTGFHLRRGKWQKQPPEGHNATLIRLVPELCDWTPLTAHICHVSTRVSCVCVVCRVRLCRVVDRSRSTGSTFQVGSLLPGVIHHIRFSASLSAFELILPAPFSDKELLKKAPPPLPQGPRLSRARHF